MSKNIVISKRIYHLGYCLKQQTYYSTFITHLFVHISLTVGPEGLGGVVGLTLSMARADRGSRPVYYLPCSAL